MRYILFLIMVVTIFAQEPTPTFVKDGVTYFGLTREQAEKSAIAIRENQNYVRQIVSYKDMMGTLMTTISAQDSLIAAQKQIISEKDDIITLTEELAEIPFYLRPPAVVGETLLAMWVTSMWYGNISK